MDLPAHPRRQWDRVPRQPQAIAAAIVAAIGLTGIAATVTTAVLTVVISIGLSVAVSFITQALFGTGGARRPPGPSDVQRVLRGQLNPRAKHYGVVHSSGAEIFYESKDGTLYQVLATGQGKRGPIIEHRLNNKAVTLNSSGIVQEAQYKGRTRILLRDGDPDQLAFAELTAIFPEWTEDHRCRGVQLAFVEFGPAKSSEFTEMYPGGNPPEYSEVKQTTALYDPRKDSTRAGGSGSHRLDNPDTWEFSSNGALCYADYLASEDGYALGYDLIDWDQVMIEADVCDENVSTVNGLTVNRYEVGGSYNFNVERRAVEQEFAKALDAYLYQTADGLVRFHVGRWIEPTVHITDDAILTIHAINGSDPLDTANVMFVNYSEPNFGFVETESAGYEDTESIDETGLRIEDRVDIFFCQSHNQAVRLGKRAQRKLNPEWTLQVKLNLVGLDLLGERFCLVTSEELGITALPFEVEGLQIDTARNTVSAILSSVQESDFDFDSSVEEGQPPIEPENTGSDVAIPVPTGLALSVRQVSLGDTNGVAVVATWNSAPRAGLEFEAEFREDGSADPFTPMVVSAEDESATTGVVESGLTYEVRVRSVSTNGIPSPYSETESILATADNVDAVAPAVPGSFTHSTAGAGASTVVTLSWINGNSANHHAVMLYRGITTTFSEASAIDTIFGSANQPQEYDDTPGATGTFYYWITAVNASDTESSEVGPETVTIT